MADVFTQQKRSEVMSRIRSKGNRTTEARFAELLRLWGFTGWRRHLKLPGCPDFAFPRARVALFVDGCFWHFCPKHGRIPVGNRRFWKAKLTRNVERRREVLRLLRARRWRVMRVWEHDLKEPARVAARLRTMLAKERLK